MNTDKREIQRKLRPMPSRAYCPLPTSVPCIIVVVPAFGRGPRNSDHGPRTTVLETRPSDHGSCNSTLNTTANFRYNITVISEA